MLRGMLARLAIGARAGCGPIGAGVFRCGAGFGAETFEDTGARLLLLGREIHCYFALHLLRHCAGAFWADEWSSNVCGRRGHRLGAHIFTELPVEGTNTLGNTSKLLAHAEN